MSRTRELCMDVEVMGRTFCFEDTVLTLVSEEEPEIVQAYFAEKKIENVDEAAGTHTYTFASTTTDTSTDAKKDKIATVILKKVNSAEKNNKKHTTQAFVRSKLTEDSYAKDATITIDLLKTVEKVSYPKVTSAPMGYQVYLIVETKKLKDKKAKIKIREKEEGSKLLKSKDDALPVLVFAKKEDTTTNTEASDWIEIDVKEENGKKEGGAIVLHKEDKGDKIEVGIKKIQLRPKEDKIKTEGEDAVKSFEGWQEALYIRENETEEGKKATEEAKVLEETRKNETFITLTRDTDADKKENKKSYPKKISGPKTIEVGKDAVYTIDTYGASATEEDKKNIRWSFYVQGEPKTTTADKEKTYINAKSKSGWYTYAKMEMVDNKNKLTIVFDKALIGKKVQIEAFRGSPDINNAKDYVRTTTVQKVATPKIVKRETTSLWLQTQCDSVENAGEVIDKEFKSYFKLETSGLLFPFRTIPLNHSDGYKNKDYKVWDYELHEKNYATFGYKRGKDRIHAARDLYYEVNEPVYAIFDGVVKIKKLFYYDTWEIVIEHDYEYEKGYKLVVRYGEVNKNNISVEIGDKVKRGQKIAEIGLLYNSKKKAYIRQPYPDKRGMLHIEMYTGEEVGKSFYPGWVPYSEMLHAKSTNFSVGRSFKRRRDLFDPKDLLNKMLINSRKEGLIK